MQVNQTHSILSFDENLIMEIFSYLSAEELAKKVSLVCKIFCNMAQKEKLWKDLTIRQFGKLEKYQSMITFTTWKRTYIELQELATTSSKDWRANCIKLLVGDKSKSSKNKQPSALRLMQG
jgi:hypothetical protein